MAKEQCVLHNYFPIISTSALWPNKCVHCQ